MVTKLFMYQLSRHGREAPLPHLQKVPTKSCFVKQHVGKCPEKGCSVGVVDYQKGCDMHKKRRGELFMANGKPQKYDDGNGQDKNAEGQEDKCAKEDNKEKQK
ncbi:MAG: hypothetical protein OHK93_004620 [Ramalina farinacea]|uniref:Uncharacterized protein n=1 Tax=Ramalina farinacea TaxID=258253 RepID=A0AA43QUS8_9LECA|nr:hypothetical protein [Ramalina farinacea]